MIASKRDYRWSWRRPALRRRPSVVVVLNPRLRGSISFWTSAKAIAYRYHSSALRN
jgi:hypothetical protein